MGVMSCVVVLLFNGWRARCDTITNNESVEALAIIRSLGTK